MAYILTDGAENIVAFPYNIGMLRRDNPNTSFPASPSDEMLADWNMLTVTQDSEPTYDPLTQSAAPGTPVTADGGVTWTQPWVITNLDVTEQATKLAVLQAAATAQQEQILSEADQYVVTALVQGKALTPEFEAYRAAIVDLENLPGYPAETVFPDVPFKIFSTDVNTQVQVDLANIKTNSVTFNTVDPTIIGTESTHAQADWTLQTLSLGDRVELVRAPYGGELINLKVDGADEADWGALYDADEGEYAEWARGDIGSGTWASDVTALTFETELDDFGIGINDPTFAAQLTGGEYVVHHVVSGRYWKFEFHSWEVTDDSLIDGNTTPGAFSYTRTEYSDPATGTLDLTTAVTHTVTGWADSDSVDVVIPGQGGLAIHRGMKDGIGNVLADYGEDASQTVLGSPALTEWAVVKNFIEVTDPSLKFYSTIQNAYSGSGGMNSAAGSKVIAHNLLTDQYFGLDITAWNTGDGGSWSANVRELNVDTLAAITFADGSKLSTKPGNVTSDLDWVENYWGGDQTAPLTFFKNSDIGNTSVSFDSDHIMGRTSFGLVNTTLNGELSGDWLRADRIMSYGSTYTNGVTMTEGVASIYSGSFQHAYSWANYNIARRKSVERIKVVPYATDFTIGISNTFTGNFQGHYTTKYYIENTHATNVATIVGEGISLNEVVALPTVNPGETWMVEIEVYTTTANVAKFSVIAVRQIV